MPRTNHPLAVLAVAGIVLAAGCLGFLAADPDSFAGSYQYGFGMDVHGTVTNVTVYVPLPVGPEGTPFNASVLAPDGTVEGAFSADVVETEFGPMLALRADRFEVEPRYYAVVERDGVGERVEISEAEYDPENPDHQRVGFRTVDVVATVSEPYPVETRDPVGTEPVLPAVEGRTEAACPYPTTDEAVCYEFGTTVYLSYEAAADTAVVVVVSAEGRNEWFAGGWTGNGYRDSVSVRVTGPQDGWVTAEGNSVTGNGNYRE